MNEVTVYAVVLGTLRLEHAQGLYSGTGELPEIWEYERTPVDHRSKKRPRGAQ